MQAGKLRERLTFQKRLQKDDDTGNPLDDWEDQFTVAARVFYRRGGETVLAARLEGTQPVEITVRHSSQTMLVTPDWRAVDARNTASVFNIRAAAPDEKRTQIVFMAETGVAT